MRLLLVANPTSHAGSAAKRIPVAVGALRRAGHDVDLHTTTAAPSALGEALVSCDRAVALGGDGTFARVANAILDSGISRPLALLPAGIANNHGRSLSIPSLYEDLEGAVSIALGDERRAVDAGWLRTASTRQRFYDTVGWGFQAAVLQARARHFRRLGEPGYALALLATLPHRPHRFDAAIGIDGHRSEHRGLTDALVSNTPWYAGHWIPDRTARPDDGLFELVLAEGWRDLASRLWTDLAARSPLAWRRDPKGKSFTLDFSRPLQSQIDGDPGPISDHFEVEVDAGALEVVAPHPSSARL